MELNAGNNNYKYDFLIVGAGLYGSTCARQLTDKGYRVLVVEKQDHPGGAAYTEFADGICVHSMGPHIFHTDSERVWEYVNRFAVFRDFINRPAAEYKGERYSLPFCMHTFRQMWGVSDPDEARNIIQQQTEAAGLNGREPADLEEQAVCMVGTEIYEKLIKGYTEKQWGRPCKELPASVIKRIPLRFDYDDRYFSDRFQAVPEEGYTLMAEKLLKGSDLITGTDFLDPHVRNELEGKAEKIIFSGRIDAYYDYCCGHLEYRTVRFEHERISGQAYFQDRAVVNYTDRDVPWTRITEHKHFAADAERRPYTIITREYPEKWKPGMQALFPVNDDASREIYIKYLKLAEADSRVIFGGRLGRYKYYDMDDVIALALDDTDGL